MASNNQTGFFVTAESQKDHTAKDRKLSYVGMRNFSQVDKIDEVDIVGANGELRGIKNRVRAGLANFENVVALERVSSAPVHTYTRSLVPFP